MTNHNTAIDIVTQLDGMNVPDDLFDAWQAVFDAAENLAVALEREVEFADVVAALRTIAASGMGVSQAVEDLADAALAKLEAQS